MNARILLVGMVAIMWSSGWAKAQEPIYRPGEISQKITEIQVAALLRQYDKVFTLKLEAQFELARTRAFDADSKVSAATEQNVDFLEMQLAQLTDRLRKYEAPTKEPASKQAAPAAK